MNKRVWIFGGLSFLGIVLILTIIFGLIFAGGYNNLVDKDVDVDSAYAQVDNRLIQRHALITQLVAVVEGLTTEEQAIYAAITSIRDAYSGNDPIADDVNETEAFNNFLAIVEDNIDIVSDQGYLNLMESISQMESALAIARKDYNDAVAAYNAGVRRFPNIIFAQMFGFEKAKEYWSKDDTNNTVPSINFSN